MAQTTTFLAFTSALLLLLAPAWAGIIAQPSLSYVGDEHAVAHTQQNVVRSFDGTVSHYAKSVATPYSQVHKQDTRISNNVYQPAIAKTVTYAAPAQVYTPHQPAVYTHSAPVAAAAPVYQHQQPIPSAPVTYASHQPQTVIHYSPAETVSHMSFDGFGTHWGF
ncbi:larval/pupal cuticle protein H1C [Drosophila sulfurigaster albostrigata]|uniref:larval/pupal cuticle protein H1C n=1 Tax=Drosophila sulfurigaster albostrigata TaxID=89887 RepID=UPI002D21E854|nr:larval/pupal cuticle protein H1C [Drosophila sulfurigaster albostrigata]